jgi:hypothetical protein
MTKSLTQASSRTQSEPTTNVADPIVTYSTAKGNVQSAYLIMANPDRYQLPNDSSFYLSFHLLCGFAVELYLKAFLAKKGYSERELRSVALRHDLNKLYELARAKGLRPNGSKLLVDLLAAHHKSFEFRYMNRTSRFLAFDLCTVFTAFSALDAEVDNVVGASASHGRSVGTGWSFPGERALWRFGPA